MKDINEMTAEQLIDYMDNGAFYDSAKKSDIKHAMGILEKYADKGNADAQYKLGQLYNAPEEKGYAQKWYVKAIAAYESDIDTANNEILLKVAHAYLFGEGVEKNTDRALDLYTKVADSGDGRGHKGIAYCYSCYGTPDTEKEKYWKDLAKEAFRKRAEEGDALAQCEYGFMLHQSKDRKNEAAKWYGLSAQQGYIKGIQKLIFCYEHGEGGVSVDMDKAKEWTKKLKAIKKTDNY